MVEPYEAATKSETILILESTKERNVMLETRAVVIDVGPVAWCEEPTPRAKVGDRVLVSNMAGVVAVGPLDGKRYRVINDRDVFCGLVEGV